MKFAYFGGCVVFPPMSEFRVGCLLLGLGFCWIV